MIVDTIANSHLYKSLSSSIGKAFRFLEETDMNALELGKHMIEGDALFAIVMEYETKNEQECLLEAHRKYIDLQYIVSGRELIGVTPLTGQSPVKEYSDTEDYALFKDDPSMIKLEAEQFAIFFPTDLHMPCVKVDGAEKVRKVVVKIRVE